MQSVDYPNASALAGGVDGITDLKRKQGGDIVMWGGPTVAAAAIEAGYVHEYHFDIHPVIEGRGKKLFAKVTGSQRLRRLSTEVYPSGVLSVEHAAALG